MKTLEELAREICLAVHTEDGKVRPGVNCTCKSIVKALKQVRDQALEEAENIAYGCIYRSNFPHDEKTADSIYEAIRTLREKS